MWLVEWECRLSVFILMNCISFYDVDNIIRIGSAGAYADRLAVYDVVLADSAWSQSSFAKVQNGCMDDVLYPSEALNTRILDAAHCLQIPWRLRVFIPLMFFIQKIMWMVIKR